MVSVWEIATAIEAGWVSHTETQVDVFGEMSTGPRVSLRMLRGHAAAHSSACASRKMCLRSGQDTHCNWRLLRAANNGTDLSNIKRNHLQNPISETLCRDGRSIRYRLRNSRHVQDRKSCNNGNHHARPASKRGAAHEIACQTDAT